MGFIFPSYFLHSILSWFLKNSPSPQFLGLVSLLLLLVAIYGLNYITLRHNKGGGFTLNMFRLATGSSATDGVLQTTTPAIIRQGIWLVSPFYYLMFITLSISLVIFPLLSYLFMGKNILVD